MRYATSSAQITKSRVHAIIVGIYQDGSLSAAAEAVNTATQGRIQGVIKRQDFKGKKAQTMLLQDLDGIRAPRILLVGLGKTEPMKPENYLAIATAAITQLKGLNARKVLYCLTDTEVEGRDLAWVAMKTVEQFEDATYQYLAMKGTKAAADSQVKLAQVDLYASREHLTACKKGMLQGTALSIGKRAAKDLGNAPSNVCTPSFLADAARQLAKDYPSVKTQVLNEKQMEKLGMGAFLSVSKGSVEPGKMITMHYRGGNPRQKPHVIIGKGITFDTGGISLKPGSGMWEMIYDMCGAASVYGTMQAIAELNPEINVVGIMAAAENMPSGNASKPGDIVKTMSGQTVEILNTDAEGRLVLCDALTYADKFNPASVIDIATLTGACVVALGSHATAVFANDDDLAQEVIDAGNLSHDRAWRLPIWEDYQSQINSAFADMQNIGGREAGSITAACFLARFAKKYRWAHLDIAGTGFKWAGMKKGSTGRPVGLLTQYLLTQAGKKS